MAAALKSMHEESGIQRMQLCPFSLRWVTNWGKKMLARAQSHRGITYNGVPPKLKTLALNEKNNKCFVTVEKDSVIKKGLFC